MTFTAIPDDSARLIRLDVAGLTTPVVVTADAGGSPYPVRDAQPVAPGVTSVDDREAPFGVVILYTATDGAGGLHYASATLNVDTPRLDSPGLASLGVDIAIVSDTPPEWAGGSVVHPIVGRRDPVVTAQPMRLRSGELQVSVAGLGDVAAVLSVCADGMPVLLRTPCGSLFRDGWLAVTGATESAPNPRHPSRTLTLSYVECGRPSGGSAGRLPWTYGDVVTEHGTYAEVRAAYVRYADLAAGPPP
jgi:hypothetical protein